MKTHTESDIPNGSIPCNGVRPSKAEVYTLAAELVGMEETDTSIIINTDTTIEDAVIKAIQKYYYKYYYYDYYYADKEIKVLLLLFLAAIYS